jgi:predicted acylesterase/phospholipase RssA
MTQEEKQLLIKEAENILRGTDRAPEVILALAKKLKKAEQFTYARKILARARADERIENDRPLRLVIFQQSALCTYKDEELPADSRLDTALKILHKGDDLSTTVNQETLGLAGAIYKRKWEVDSRPAQLERSYAYYRRGYDQGPEKDQGYTGINAAYVLDLLAHQESEDMAQAKVPPDAQTLARIGGRRAEAARIRADVARKVARLVEGTNAKGEPNASWWHYSTIAEAHFGLGTRYDPATGGVVYDENEYAEAVKWLEDGSDKFHPPVWEFETTARQLASIARLQSPPDVKGKDLEGTPPWRALERFLGRTDPVRSAFVGKIGLGLSGGGFRASLFHIGVLARLAEMDALRSVEVLSCVSGGSIIGAHYYLEVRKLVESKPDDLITKQDYIDLVARVAHDFLKGVQTNIRTLIAAEPWTNLKMIFGADTVPRKWVFGPAYSRTMRAGELYESKIFSLVKDGTGEKDPRWLNDLRIHPLVDDNGELRKQADFNPKRGNWLRGAKVPILILNAATLNTGHSWHFTASYMGEPPAGIDSRIDGNDRFRRMYYGEAPEGYRRVRLGYAVAASACVPGLFEPLAFPKLYPDRVVRLIDGGTCDNQGVGGLLEQDCNVILISDGSGQMESQKDPSRGLLGVPLRSTSILQARVRQSQFQDLWARRRSRLLRGMMFVHLKNDLDVDPIDWVDCMDPSDTNDDDARRASRRGKLTSYGIAKDVQQCLANVRTDLDSFSEVEAYALMTSGYRQTEYAFGEEKCVQGFESDAQTLPWEFLKVEEGMKGAGRSYQHVKRLLSVSDMLAFKIWKLKKWLKVVAVALAVVIAAVGAWACWYFRDATLVRAVTVGAIAMFFAGLALTALGTAFVGKRLMRVMRLRETLVRAAVGIFVGVAGSVAALIHLKFFDPMFIREGSLKNYESNNKAAEAPGGNNGSERPASVAEKRAPSVEAKAAATASPPAPPPARAEAAVVEVVAAVAPADTLPGAATHEAPGGNGHAKEAATEESFPGRIEVRDTEERQN